MPDAFLKLSATDRHEVLALAADRAGRPAYLLEKDVWVVWTLSAMFSAPFGDHLVFKGGTSLSKAYGAIRRFSEDVDLTYDIRQIAPDLTENGTRLMPPSRSQQRRWTDTIRERLTGWLESTALDALNRAIAAENVPARARRGEKPDTLVVEYEGSSEGHSYVAPVVLLEFGARSTGEPADRMNVGCDAAAHLPDVTFPTASPRVMHVERTFWEKATAIHVACSGGRANWDRFARHWYDLVQLDRKGHAERALVDRELAKAVAEHKANFFRETVRATGEVIDYGLAVGGQLRLVPTGEVLQALRADYGKMIDGGLFFDVPASFESVIAQCKDIEDRANQR